MDIDASQRSLNTATVGERIKQARESRPDARKMSQADLAHSLGISRAAVAQWELNITSPSIEKVKSLARLLDVQPEWLAYGVSREPRILYAEPEGSSRITEVVFGSAPDEVLEVGFWSAPTAWIEGKLRAAPANLRVVEIQSDAFAPTYQDGDKVLVDLSQSRPSPTGMFLYFDGIGVSPARITVVPGVQPRLRVVTATDVGEAIELPVDSVHIIGRIRGCWRKAT